MVRRSILTIVVVGLALLALAAPALAGGWAVVTLDALPREVHAGQSFQIGFMVRQHGKTPTNQDLEGKPLKPIVTAIKQAGAAAAPANGDASIRAEARQEGPTGHYVVDLTFPSDGVWEWQIALPTYYVQESPSGGNAAILAPLTVLPAAVAAPTAEPGAGAFIGLSPALLRWAGVVVLLAALALALYAQPGIVGRRPAQTQK
ncbi:MAG TPA: hypothetical protein VKE41_03725 [Roseiflexaceae bacterium]|nr:hypothetical protein [Roseiflexaceae bacterium]